MKSKLVFAAIAVLAMMMIPTGALASPATVIVTNVDALFFSPCETELIHIVGTVTDRISVSVTNGIAHVSIHESWDMTATGAVTGNKYIIKFEANENENVNLSGAPVEINIVQNGRLISQGSAPNENFKVREHLTINANGTVTVDRVTIEDNCVG